VDVEGELEGKVNGGVEHEEKSAET